MKKLNLFLIVTSFFLIGSIKRVGYYTVGPNLSIVAKDNFVYLSKGGILEKIEISDIKNPKIVDSLITEGVILDMKILEEKLFIANCKSGFKVIDLEKFKQIFSYNTDGITYSISVHFPYLYLSDGEEGIKIFDIKGEPKLISKIQTFGTARDNFFYEDYLYVADGESGLTIINVKDKKNPKIVSNIRFPSYAFKIFVEKKYAYLAGGKRFRIIDVSKPETPKEVFALKPKKMDLYLPLPRILTDAIPIVSDVIVKNRIVYLATGEGGFVVINAKNIKSPKIISSLPINAVNMYMYNDMVYVASSELGWQIVDISDPSKIKCLYSTPYGTNLAVAAKNNKIFLGSHFMINVLDGTNYPPKIISNIITEDMVLKLYPTEKYLYVANAKAGLKVIDQNTLKIVADFDTDGIVYDLFVKYPYVYIADGPEGIKIIDLDKKITVSKLKTKDSAKGITLRDGYLFVACGDAGIEVIDISNLSNPKKVKNYDTEGHTYKVKIEGNYLFVADKEYLRILDVSNVDSIKEVGKYKVHEIHLYYHPCVIDVEIRDGVAYISAGEGELIILDVKDPSKPKELDMFTVHAINLYLDENKIYVCCGEYGWGIVEITDPNFSKPSAPLMKRWVRTTYNANSLKGLFFSDWKASGTSRKITVHKNYAFLSTLGDGIYVIDIKDPKQPKLISHIKHSAGIYNRIKNKYLYSAWGNLFIHDISNIKAPKFVSFYPGKGRGSGMSINENYVYLCAYANALRIIDVSNPYSPREVAFINPGGRVWVCFYDKYLYAAPMQCQLAIVDVSISTAPKRLGIYNVRKYRHPVGIYTSGSYAFLAAEDLIILDISDKRNIKKVSELEIGPARQIFVEGNYAYITSLEEGIRVIDVSDVFNPKEVDFYPTQAKGPWGIYVRDKFIYLADGEAGLQILKFEEEKLVAKKEEIFKLKIGISRKIRKRRHKYPLWYYNELLGKPYGILDVKSKYLARCSCWPIVGVCDETYGIKNYVPFLASGNTGVIGCGVNPFQETTHKRFGGGKFTSYIGTR